MGTCIARMSHSCGSRKGLQIFEDDSGSINGYCFSCNTFVKHPLGDGATVEDIPKKDRLGKTKEEIEEEINDVLNNFKSVDLPDRKLRADVLDRMGIKIGFSQADGVTPVMAYFPYKSDGNLLSYKIKLFDGKKFWSIGDQKDVDLFNWDRAVKSGAKRLVITEGEFDCAALERIIELYTPERYADLKDAVVSLPHGSSGAYRDLSRLSSKIRKHFKEVVLCYDDDDAGKLAVEESMKVFPEATVVPMHCKDANQALIEGSGKTLYNALKFNTTKPKNSRIIWGSDIHEEAKEKAEWGVSWPWQGMTDLTRGIRTGETIYLAGAEKIGKSEFVNAIGAHLIKEHGWKILMAKPEEANKKTYKLVNSKIMGKIFHDPKVEFDERAYDLGGRIIADNLCMLNLYQNIDWETLKGDIYHAVGMGVKAVFIDPITNFTNGMGLSESNTFLQKMSQEAAIIAKDLDIVIFLFCHLNKPPKELTPFDRGGKVTTDFFAGSSAMARSCHYAMAIQGNKDPELPKFERNKRELVILADREYGECGSIKLNWDENTSLLN